MSQQGIDPATKGRLIEEMERLLKAFHEAEGRNPRGFESVSCRGQLAGVRRSLGIIVGQKNTTEVLQDVRQRLKLGIPPVGPVTDEGQIHGWDSDADMGF